MLEYQSKFIKMMQHAIEMSFYKYGNAKKTYPILAQANKCIAERLDYYINGRPYKGVAPHNKDYLVDIANFAMLEAMFPHKPSSKTAKSDESSGWKADFSTQFVEAAINEEKSSVADVTKTDAINMYLSLYNKSCDQTYLKAILRLACDEFNNPTFSDSFHDINMAGSKISPGLSGGISYKELMGRNDGYIYSD